MTVDDLDNLKQEYWHCPTCFMPPYHGAKVNCLKCGTKFIYRTFTTVGLMDYIKKNMPGLDRWFYLGRSRVERHLNIKMGSHPHKFGNGYWCPTQEAKDLVEAWVARHRSEPTRTEYFVGPKQ